MRYKIGKILKKFDQLIEIFYIRHLKDIISISRKISIMIVSFSLLFTCPERKKHLQKLPNFS